MANIVSGDLQGSVLWDTYWTFWGPNAHRFRGIEIISKRGGRHYRASEITAAWAIKNLVPAALLSNSHAAVLPIAAGPVGALIDITEPAATPEAYEVEFIDGNRIVVVEDHPATTRAFQIFKKHVAENGLLRRPK